MLHGLYLILLVDGLSKYTSLGVTWMEDSIIFTKHVGWNIYELEDTIYKP